MKRHPFAGGLLTATLATGLLLVGSTSASADTTTDRPPVLSNAWFTCSDEGAGAGAEAKLRNPNKVTMHYMVTLQGGDYAESYVVSPAAHSVAPVEFAGVPNGTFVLSVQGADGDVLADTRVDVQCNVKPTETPTGTPTGTPTSTPTTPPSETPSTSPTTPPSGTSSATTAVPSTSVPVPTAVDAGIPGSDAQDVSNHGRTIIGAGLLAAVSLMIALGSRLVRRRRGLHQL